MQFLLMDTEPSDESAWARLLLRFLLQNWRANRRDFRRRPSTLERHCRVVWRTN